MLQSVLLIDKARQNLHVSIRVAACLVNTPQIDRCVTTFALAVSDYTFQIDFQEATVPRFRLPQTQLFSRQPAGIPNDTVPYDEDCLKRNFD